MREAAQMVSYEVPMAICVLVPVIVAGSMDLNYVAKQQDWLWNWYVFHDPFTFVAFWTYFCCATAQCKRAPFDLAEAESELVAGFHTEYSGLRWSFFFMAEYASMFAVSGIAVNLFLGGWNIGFLPNGLQESMGTFAKLVGVVVFIAKSWLLVFVMMWVRWTLPRLRIDQVMMTCLKYLLPISCALLLGVGLWQAFATYAPWTRWIAAIVGYALCALTVAGLAWVVYTMLTTFTRLPVAGVPNLWTPTGSAKQDLVKT
jgi:NADH-quinone oxidoreductase subunit H